MVIDKYKNISDKNLKITDSISYYTSNGREVDLSE